MKCKVKGLVFVGFAAAILAGAAHAAGENIVTSKAYTDATYQAKTAANNAGKVLKMNTDTAGDIGYTDVTSEYSASTFGGNTTGGNLVTESAVAAAIAAAGAGENDSFELTSHKLDGTSGSTIGGTTSGQNGNDTTMYPSAAAVKEYVTDVLADNGTAGSGYQHTSTADFQVGGANGTWKTVSNGTYTTAGSDGNGGFKVDVNALNGTGTNNFANVSGGTGADTDKLPTAAAVKAYVDSKATADLDGKQDKVAGTNGVAMVGHGDGEWLPVQDTTYAELIRAQDPNDASKYVMRVAVKDAKIANHGVTDSNAGTTNEIVASSDKLTTANAVAEYVTDQLANGGTNQNGYQEKSNANYQIGNSTGTWDTMGNGTYTTWARDANTGAVTVDVAATTTGTDVGSAQSTSTNLATDYAVKQYVDTQIQAQPASSIPAKSTTNCTDAHPCALVAETDGFHWRVMAVDSANQTVAAGTCGDATGNCGDA